MYQTLFLIPHEIGGLPVFGYGWALIVWGIVCALAMVYLARTQGLGRDTLSYLPVLLIVAAAIVYVAPMMEIQGESPGVGEFAGLPIRGYGVMMLLGVVAAVGITVYRARRMGLDPEIIFSLAFYMFLAGIVGARVFFVIEYWREYAANPLAVFNVTQGGLVVYGSVIGGVPAGIYYLWRRNLPILAVSDLIAPGMLIGLAFGRVGCLMNGCCFGAVCETPWPPAMTFPKETAYALQDSPPYAHQLQHGQIHGLRIDGDAEGRPVVQNVYDDAGESVRKTLAPGDRLRNVRLETGDVLRAANLLPQFVGANVRITTADRRTVELPIRESLDRPEVNQIGLRARFDDNDRLRISKLIVGGSAHLADLRMGEEIVSASLPPLAEMAAATAAPDDTPAQVAQMLLLFAGPRVEFESEDGRIALFNATRLPEHSRPVHPTQIYSAVNAFLLFAFLWVLYPFRRRDGEVFAAMLLLYPVARFLLEAIRNDEPAQFGTGLTIAQLLSIGIFALGVALVIYIVRRPLGSALPPQTTAPTTG